MVTGQMLDKVVTDLSSMDKKVMENSLILDDATLHRAVMRSVVMESFIHSFAVDIMNTAGDPIEFFRRSLILGMKMGYHLNNIEKRGMS